ncbi:hypothetical protein ACPPVU_09960 [Mucilaginibacter sp. McL0603]|uniref:hypothetical protein n=1 Tax=Mucilaginibacter sp. McL0603 TaxID=3415670 RepID=UPI003CE7F388
MKKLLLFTICVTLAFSSCKKSSSDIPVNTISATIDGVDESFNTNPIAELGTAISLNSNLIISGGNGSGTGSDSMAITIESNNTLAKGSYTNASTNNSSYVSVLYNKGPFSLAHPSYYTTDVNGAYPTTVTITSMSSTNIQGTFSGKLLFTDGTTVKNVTNGKFNLTIK